MKNYLIIGLIMIFGCKQKNNSVAINDKLVDIDTITFRSVDQIQNGNLINLTFGLDSLENVQDGLEIRIFRYYYSSDTLRLFVIKRQASSWSGFTAMIHAEYNERGEVRYLPSNRVMRSPKSGWDKLGNQLLSKEILNLGERIPLPDNSSSDGDWVNIEYNANGVYREYSVQSPEDSDILGAKKVTEIIHLIEEELGFKHFATSPSL